MASANKTVMGKERGAGSEAQFESSAVTEQQVDSSRSVGMLFAIFQEHTDALFVKDLEGRYILLNNAAAKLIGKPMEEVVGKTDASIFDLESARIVREADQKVLETGASIFAEEVLTASGVTRIYHATRAPYFDSEGKVVGVIGISRDITAQRMAEEARARSESLLRLVVQTLPVAVQVMDPEGDIILHNPACERIWGEVIEDAMERYSAVEACWHDTQIPVAPQDWASWKARNDGESTFGQLIDIRSFDGEVRTILNSGVPIKDDGKIIGAVVINEDVTERRRLQKMVNQAQKMEAVGLLAGGVAHDFNNLLTVISGCAELLLAEVAGDQKELVREIQKSAELGANLTRQLLSFSRQSVLQPQNLDLNRTVSASRKMLRRLIEENIEISLDLEPGVGAVKVDPTEFDQMLLNLVVNARDAMPRGGEIRISTTRKRAPEGYVALAVKDNGEGIQPEIKDQIFDPFFTTKSPGGGTGLGLSTVYGIVQQSGGTVEVESTPGEGATFTICLPSAELSDSDEREALPRTIQGDGNETVLLVEDQTTVRRLLTRALERAGYKVVQASNGVDALEHWETLNHSVDLVVTDVIMPEMGGFALVDKLREHRSNLRVIFLSGYPNEVLLAEELDSPLTKYIPKPVSIAEFLKQLRNSLDFAPGG